MTKTLGPVVVSILLIAAMPVPSPAQLGITVGVQGGLNIANASFDPDLTSDFSKSSRTGLAISGVVEFQLAGPVAISLQPSYLQKGAKIEGPFYVDQIGNPVQTTRTEKLAMFEIPLLLKAKLPVGPARPYAFAGPTLGITLSATETDELKGGYTFENGSSTQDTDVKSTTSSTDFGLMLGAGAEFSVAPMVSITVDGRYALGFTNLLTNQGNQQPQVTVKSNGIMILAGVLVGL